MSSTDRCFGGSINLSPSDQFIREPASVFHVIKPGAGMIRGMDRVPQRIYFLPLLCTHVMLLPLFMMMMLTAAAAAASTTRNYLPHRTTRDRDRLLNPLLQ